MDMHAINFGHLKNEYDSRRAEEIARQHRDKNDAGTQEGDTAPKSDQEGSGAESSSK